MQMLYYYIVLHSVSFALSSVLLIPIWIIFLRDHPFLTILSVALGKGFQQLSITENTKSVSRLALILLHGICISLWMFVLARLILDDGSPSDLIALATTLILSYSSSNMLHEAIIGLEKYAKEESQRPDNT